MSTLDYTELEHIDTPTLALKHNDDYINIVIRPCAAIWKAVLEEKSAEGVKNICLESDGGFNPSTPEGRIRELEYKNNAVLLDATNDRTLKVSQAKAKEILKKEIDQQKQVDSSDIEV